MLSDSLDDFQMSLLDKESLSIALDRLEEFVHHYASPDWDYPDYVIDALLDGITAVRKSTPDKAEALLRLLTISELVIRVCGFGLGTNEQLRAAIDAAATGQRYKLKTMTAKELAVMGAAHFDPSKARTFPPRSKAATAKTLGTNKATGLPITPKCPSTNVFTLDGRPYTPT